MRNCLVKLHCLFVVSVVSALGGCGSGSLSEEQIQKAFSSRAVFDVVQNSTEVEAYRIDPEGVDWPSATVDDYPVLSGPIVVERPSGEKLRTVLSDVGTYYWSDSTTARGCGFPRPGVRLTFKASDSEVDLLFCFECDDLDVFENGKKVSGKFFGPGRPALVTVMKRIFPDDAVVRGLSEQR